MHLRLIKSRRAFALVLVLIALVISSSMAVFFLTSVARERLGVNLYASGSEVHHLAGMPVSRVIGQINAATKEGTASAPVSWASQPGMIRTYDAGGDLRNAHKLYSWDNPVESGSGFDPSAPAQVPPSDWKDKPATYTDLNQQVNGIYPIVDPRAEKGQDPDNASSPGVEGFSIDRGNSAVSSSGLPAPMPVKWLYVLEDGEMVAPTGASGSAVTVAGATKDNPIVGRIAYWTDDETCKVNINTASEGNYWDVPRSGSRDDIHFAGNPLVRNEFQRTPGHPATTSMSAVFPNLVSSENTTDRTQSRWNSSYRTQLESIYKMSPRIDWGSDNSAGIVRGSLGGTYPVKTYDFDYEPREGYLLANPLPLEIVPDVDRLYASADELWFRAPDSTAVDRQNQIIFSAEGIEASDLQRRLFFLTANSRAPETTLFETPRVSLWPITWPNRSSYFASRTGAMTPSLTNGNPNVDKVGANPEWITAQERLIAFCGTLNAAKSNGGDRYFFQRKDPDSPLKDWTDIQRNQDLVNYLTRSMGQPVPGFSGGTLENKLGGTPNKNWFALNALNFSRSQINQYTAPDGLEGIRYSFTGVSFRSGKIKGGGSHSRSEPNAKIVTPLRAALGSGPEMDSVGNFPVLEEALVVFYAAARREPVPPALTGPADPADAAYPDWRNPFTWQYLINPGPAYGGVAGTVYPVGAQTTVMRGVLLLDFTGLEPGVPVRPTFWVKVSGGSFSVNGTSIGLPSGNPVAQIALSSSSRANSVVNALYRRDTTRSKIFSNSAPVDPTVYQLVSNDILMDPAQVDFSFGGQRITVALYACDPAGVDVDPTNNSNLKVYEKVIDFSSWSGNLPVPTAPRWSTMSRVYASTGALPGGTGLKSAIPPADQPLSTRWRPNPDLAGTNMVPAETRPVSWAWSEFAPILSTKSATLPDVRSKNSMLQERNRGADRITYYYRTAGDNQAKYNSPITSGGVRDLTDPDDARETGDTRNNLSTNFRKRVESLDHRNTNGSRTPFYIEGTLSTDLGSSGGSGPYYDMFLNFTEDPFRESLPLITPYDTAISMVNAPTSGSEDRDPRLAQVPGIDDFKKITTVMGGVQPSTVIDGKYPRPAKNAQWHHFSTPGPIPNVTGYQSLPKFRNKDFARRAAGAKGGTWPPGTNPGGELGNETGVGAWIGFEGGALNKVPDTGDWTGMPGRFYDGGMLARPDQDYQRLYQDTSGALSVPYYPRDIYGTNVATGTTSDVSYFSPNRQVPSPVILGTIPRSRTVGWQTLAFSPNPAAGIAHPGLAATPNAVADHLLLDLFWMPVAEPYPISDQLSTSGKVNLNYRIMPFSYIQRKTALHAVMKNTWIPSLEGNDNNVANYKSHMAVRNTRSNVPTQTRHAIDISETLKDFDEVFDSGDIFRSASQLCEMFLVPQVPGAAQTIDTVRTAIRDLGTFWTNRWPTSDNAREEPYNHLYSRVTTKSNTFTVHWRVQSLRKTPNTDPAEWDEARDRWVSELRGSSLIERYIDPNATNIPDYAKDSATAAPLSYFYKWRVVSENYFQP